MLKQAIFRDYQEQQSIDHTNAQAYTRETLDLLIGDVVTAARKFGGFTVIKSSQAEVQVAPGRFYDVAGAMYARRSTVTQSMLTHLAAASKRIVVVSVSGVENETDLVERDVLIDVENRTVEPQSVTTTKSRDAVLSFTQGAESADPQPPPLPASHVAIAHVLLDATQVVSVTMLLDNRIESNELLDQRTDVLEGWKSSVENRIASLASDMAALAAKLSRAAANQELVRLYEDLGRIKERVDLPDTYSDYGADRFLLPDESDDENSQALGWDAKVEMGVRFPDANADQFEMTLFSANDPNAAYQNGFLLPKYTSETKIVTGEYHSELGIAQYGFQTYDLVQKKIRKERTRYGGQYWVCTNGWAGYNSYGDGQQAPYWLPDFETYEETVVTTNGDPGHLIYYYDYYWRDSWTETYWELETIEHTITGAQIAQSFLVSNDMWSTRLGFYITSKAAAENIFVTLCEVKLGVPDLSQTIMHTTYPHANIVVGWNRVEIPPTFLEKGKRYAVVLTSGANHKFGMTYGQSYLDGTFFYSTDSVYYQGDLMRDLMFEVWGAKFNASQVTIEFGAINLDGGIRNIDILAGCIQPESTQLVYEIRPNGSGEWLPLTQHDTASLVAAPPLCQFRARFVGTRDMMPGIQLTGSRVYVARPKLAFKHISDLQTLGNASDEIYVKLIVEGFEDTPHDLACRIRRGNAGTNWETPDATTVKSTDPARKQFEFLYRFDIASGPITQFTIETTGTTNSAGNTFHVAERIHWAV
jgi:hypothetical protein